MTARPLRVAQLITGLNTGGAETMILRLLERLDPQRFHSTAISLTNAGTVGPRIAELGIEVVESGAGPLPTPGDMWRIRSDIARLNLDLVQTWTLYGNVLGGLGARMAGRAPVVWGVHHSGDDLASMGRKVVATQRLERRLAPWVPARIVACSQSSLAMMRSLGYPEAKIETILNGFDVSRLRPDPQARADVRAELGIGEDEVVVGHVARFHPVKRHDLFLRAAAQAARELPQARFVLCGAGVEPRNAELAGLAGPLGDRALLIGERADMSRLYPAFDLCCSSSSAEALPLAVGEAMACGVPVVATDCGDSADLVGDTGRIVAVGDRDALARELAAMIAMPAGERHALGEAARNRVETRYSLDRMVDAYSELWERLARRP